MVAKLAALRFGYLLPPRRFLVLNSDMLVAESTSGIRAIMKLQRLGKLKNSVTLGIKPTTYWLVAQCLNQGCDCMPPLLGGTKENNR
jgi:hypothetical protein